MKCWQAICISLIFFIMFLMGSSLAAEDIQLTVNVETKDENGLLTIRNEGDRIVYGIHLSVELDGKQQQIADRIELKPKSEQSIPFTVALPKTPGSYPLITTVSYLNEAVRLSFKDVGTFHYLANRTYQPECLQSDIRFSKEADVKITCRKEVDLRVVTSDEVLHTLSGDKRSPKMLHLNAGLRSLMFKAPIFFIETRISDDGYHEFAFQKQWLEITECDLQASIPSWFLLISSISGLLLAVTCWAKAEKSDDLNLICFVRWAWTVAIISLGLVLLQDGKVLTEMFCFVIRALILVPLSSFIPEQITLLIWVAIASISRWMSFQSENYLYFKEYVVAPLYLYIIFVNYFTLRWFIRPQPSKDKYWQFMKSCFSWFDSRAKDFDHTQAKIGARTILVKFFFTPLLVSWSINNFFHASLLMNHFDWSALETHAFLLHLLITIDVTIFAIGYLTELPQLKNTVKSVEPTFLGWFVCLICYPPFNQVSFLPFDHAIMDSAWVVPGYLQQLALIPIVILWGIYTWASLALGFKASNLTNRGIVTYGPYRFMRHPAYASKVTIWIIEGIILGKYYLMLCLAFAVVYFLRAWTEERHLSADPDYRVYKERVPTRFLPTLHSFSKKE